VAFRSVSKGKDRSIQLWKIRGFPRQPLEDTTSVAFHATKKLFAWGKQDGTVEIKYIEKPEAYAFTATKAHQEPVTELFFSPDNLYLCSVSPESQQIILWDISARMQKTPPHDGYTMAFSPDKRFLALARANNKVGLWDLKQEKYFAIFTLPSELVSKGKASLAAQEEERVLKIFFLFDGKLWGLVYESCILIVDLANITALPPGKESPLPFVQSWHHIGGTITSIVKSFDDRRLFVLDDKGALIVLSPGIA
jgi:WD40 repeat protein